MTPRQWEQYQADLGAEIADQIDGEMIRDYPDLAPGIRDGMRDRRARRAHMAGMREVRSWAPPARYVQDDGDELRRMKLRLLELTG